jgi:hypothetical protein
MHNLGITTGRLPNNAFYARVDALDIETQGSTEPIAIDKCRTLLISCLLNALNDLVDGSLLAELMHLRTCLEKANLDDIPYGKERKSHVDEPDDEDDYVPEIVKQKVGRKKVNVDATYKEWLSKHDTFTMKEFTKAFPLLGKANATNTVSAMLRHKMIERKQRGVFGTVMVCQP